MNPIRVFAKLAARVPPFDLQSGATGAPGIDAATAAALCAGMSEHSYRAALAKYAVDDTVMQWLGVELWRVAMERAQRDGWRTAGKTVDRGGRWKRSFVVWDALSGQARSSFERVLIETEGAGYARVVSILLLAETYEARYWCQPESWQLKAAVLGVGKAAYFDTWHKRINSVGVVFDSWCSAAISHVARRQIELNEIAC